MGEIRQFCEAYQFDAALTACLDAADRQLAAHRVFQEQIDIYKNSTVFDHHALFDRLHALEESTGIHRYTIDLLYLFHLMPLLQARYREAGIPEQYYLDLVDNFKIYAEKCRRVHGVWGTFIGWWLIVFFKMKGFSIGRLQYKLKTFAEPVSIGAFHFEKGERYLDVHIPPGAPLTPEACRASYAEAAQLARQKLGFTKVTISCQSWLLSPVLKQLLPPNSNILAFARDYTIVQTHTAPFSQFAGFIFDLETVPENLDELPEDTSLRRAFKAHLKAGKPVGTAWGLILWP